MNRTSFALLLTLGVACRTNEWDAAVQRINAPIAALRPTAHAIAKLAGRNDPGAVRAVIELCGGVDLPLQKIADTHLAFHALDTEPRGPDSFITDVPTHARWLLQRRYGMCQRSIWRCRDWCVESWRDLASSVDVLRREAAKHDAHLESL